MPSGTPTRAARPNPVSTRRSDTAVLATSFCSRNTSGTARNTAAGPGSKTGFTSGAAT